MSLSIRTALPTFTTNSTPTTSSSTFAQSLERAQATSSNDASSTFEPARHGPHGQPPFLDAAAKALGLSSSELDSKLRSGQSLSSIAEEQGVSPDSVTSAIAADFKSKHPDATDEQATQVASRALEGPRTPDHTPPFLDAAAKSLGLTSDELKSQLEGGASLSDVASKQGVSLDNVREALAADFASKHPDATEAQATAAAEAVVNGQRPPNESLRSFRVSELQLRELHA